MKTTYSLCAVLLGLSLVTARSQNYTASLDGAQDGGGTRQGTGFVTLSLSGDVITLNGSFSGLTTTASAAHIHGPAPVGSPANVLYPLTGLMTVAGTGGSFNGNVTLAPIGAYTVAQQKTDLDSRLWYVNIHNSTFPGGEIRGQIVPVPEPTSLVLAGLGGLMGLWMWRRRSA